MKTRLLLIALITAIAGMGTSLAACSSDDDSNNGGGDAGKDSNSQGDSGGGGGAATFTEVYDTVFSKRCGSCHGDVDAPAGKMKLIPKAAAYQSLVGTAAAGPACGPSSGSSLTRVVAGNAETSLLYNKVRTDKAQPCGAHMPKGPADGGTAVPLTPDQIETIESWINDGAQNN